MKTIFVLGIYIVHTGTRNENSDSYFGAPNQTAITNLCIVYTRYCASVRLWSDIKFTLLNFFYDANFRMHRHFVKTLK